MTRDATAADLELTLEWTLTPEGGLAGELRAVNVALDEVRLHGKPVLTVLAGGHDVEVPTIATMELRIPPYADLAPLAVAAASVSWSGHAGPDPSALMLRLGDAYAAVEVSGPLRPTRRDVGNLSSGWWTTRD
ncbi:hypothetical protein G9U51_14450 [Calidifontibacter sp. DB0510]|uniref:Uncharacterized protein n=1 Tax=Metallococcus carri TaxID=1656884 RepID=A0A967B1A7_9MICO|nr:hypothetical protein [Metallococcus carri]NHN56969.1 hypothetical protein [Metallococcus carri]NOP37714.1 hypothetical protein [Calidifontibacter sp. DB2511S]